MNTLRWARLRRLERRGKREIWHTFDREARPDALVQDFGALEILDEERLPPGASAPRHAQRDTEMITYVREGSLVYEDSAGRSGIIETGEFQRMIGRRGVGHRTTNASRTHQAILFQLGFRAMAPATESGSEQRRFSAAERQGLWCVVASPDGRRSSLRIGEDAVVYSTILDPGQHLIHELLPERRAWLHVVAGEVKIGDVVVSTGDGVGLTEERAVSVTAREKAELLLVDVSAPLRALAALS